MPYALGIDLGTARTVAAVSHNRHDGWSEPVVVPLDAESDHPGVASVLLLTGDDTVEVGEAAIRGGVDRPDLVAREFLDRVGDEVPLALAGQHYPAESLVAALVAWVVDRVEALEGMPASQLVVTHPVGWGPHRRAVLQAALREMNVPELTMLPRPVAAAEAYAASERLEVGEEVAVYSLGASRFEAAVLRRGSFGFEPRSHADSADVLGGSLFDDLMADHATAALGEVPSGPGAMAELRAACVGAKERLSTAVAVTIPTPRGSKKATVVVNRTDFDTMIRPVVEHTVRILQRAVASESASLRAVVLVGGCANVPLIAELVSAAVRVRVVPAEDPTTATARGAALAGGRVAKPTVQAQPVPVTPVVAVTDLMHFDDLGPELADIGPPPPRPPVEIAPLDPPAKGLARLTKRRGPQPDSWDEDEDERPRKRRLDDDPHDDLDESREDDSGVDLARPRSRRPADPDIDLSTPTRRRPDDSGQKRATDSGTNLSARPRRRPDSPDPAEPPRRRRPDPELDYRDHLRGDDAAAEPASPRRSRSTQDSGYLRGQEGAEPRRRPSPDHPDEVPAGANPASPRRHRSSEYIDEAADPTPPRRGRSTQDSGYLDHLRGQDADPRGRNRRAPDEPSDFAEPPRRRPAQDSGYLDHLRAQDPEPPRRRPAADYTNQAEPPRRRTHDSGYHAPEPRRADPGHQRPAYPEADVDLQHDLQHDEPAMSHPQRHRRRRDEDDA